MNNFADKFKQLEKDTINEQRKIPLSSPLSVFYGVTQDKLFRLSFVSSINPFELESTKEIRVTQGKESEGVYWTCFDLLNNEAKEVFFVFCESLIDSILDEKDEATALCKIKDRYYSWRLLLRNKGRMPFELYQGLFGELYFLSECLSKRITIEEAVLSWVGPDGYSKDFSVENDWFEIKTIGAETNTIKINSLDQYYAPNQHPIGNNATLRLSDLGNITLSITTNGSISNINDAIQSIELKDSRENF